MDSIQLAVNLQKLFQAGNYLFMKCSPEILDFSDVDCTFSLHFWSKNHEFTLKISPSNLLSNLGILISRIFEDKDITLICWNIKNFFTYVRFATNENLSWSCQIFDLKVLELFLGHEERCPNSFEKVVERLKRITQDEAWGNAKLIYKRIHLPLMTSVVPAMETEGIVDYKDRLIRHPYYEIEGQKGGRLACQKVFRNSFNPHSILPEERESFCPRLVTSSFVYLDYKHMEVSVLYWITKDENLGNLLKSDDFYTSLFKLMVKVDSVNEKQRDLCKRFFLPVIYGQSSYSLAKKLEINDTIAIRLVEKVYELFPKALNWLNDNSKRKTYDIFGRRRELEEKQLYLARNFLIQAPAAIVCLEKLIKLKDAIRGYGNLVCHIHDGYLLSVNDSSLKTVSLIAKETLEEESDLCPGLILKAICQYGKNLASLKNWEE